VLAVHAFSNILAFNVLDAATGRMFTQEKKKAMFHVDFDRRILVRCLLRKGYTAP
jgi:hypothetical protein